MGLHLYLPPFVQTSYVFAVGVTDINKPLEPICIVRVPDSC